MYNYVFFFIVLSAVIFIYSKVKAFRFLDEHGASRDSNLDGLRAFLAMFVFYHHLMLNYHIIATGKGPYTESTFFNNLGSIGVSIFFMITGYLFWGKIRNNNEINWLSLFSSRLFRIGPLYLFLMAAYCSLVLFKIDFVITYANLENFKSQLSTLFFLGMDSPSYAFMNRSEFLRGIGQTWTLFYEWLFYFSLPILSLITLKKGITATLVCSFVFLCLINNEINGYFFTKLFLLGMLSYEFKQLKNISFEGNKTLTSMITLSLIFMSMYFSNGEHVYNNSSAVCLGLAFLLIVRGCNVFGILNSTGATRIGSMSYSIYMTHGMILSNLFYTDFFKRLIDRSELYMWLYTAIAFIICLSISMLTYQFIERKGIEMGKIFYQIINNKYLSKPEQIKAP
ncbi:acyltransferase [Salmonella enterica]|nr:acyltransferase [Salmonella enterica]